MKREITLCEVLAALEKIRAPLSMQEYDIHARVAEALARAGIPGVHEARLGPRMRADFLCGTICVEIKKGKPSPKQLEKQLQKYAESPLVSAILAVVETGVLACDQILGKPVKCLNLRMLWGVAAAAAPDAPPPAPPAMVDDAPPPPPPSQTDGEDSPLPAYLWTGASGGHVYGTLSYNPRRKCWTVRGEPAMTEMCKRLFPGSDSGRRGEARFFDHRRTVGDLNWLMLRYPLDISPKDAEKWRASLSDAREYALERERALRAPTFSTPPIGAFEGTLMPFQQEGLAWLIRTRRALLADEMGLGKTVQALACVASLRLFPTLVVAPPHLTRNWQAECARFLRVAGRPPRIHVVKGLTPYALPEADIYILHYLLLRGWKHVLPAYPFQCVIFDEIQELRRAGTEKYSAASLLSEGCERVMGLSGTPIYNQGGEIWNVVNILDFHFLGDYEAFTREWCYGYGGDVVIKPDVLGDTLRREGLMLRRVKRDVLPQLPEKRRLVQEIDADSAVYERLMLPVREKLRHYGDEMLTASRRAILAEEISQEERQATGLAKAPYVCQFVRALLEAGEKILLFAHHHAVMDFYKRELSAFSPVFITGRESVNQKEESVLRFMSGGTNLCCVSLRAAAGLNLQRASCVVFGELDWSPAVHSQAEDRAHRIGQQDSLLCYYLVSPHGSDEDMRQALGLKVSQFLGLMGDQPESEAQSLESAGYARRHVERLLAREGVDG